MRKTLERKREDDKNETKAEMLPRKPKPGKFMLSLPLFFIIAIVFSRKQRFLMQYQLLRITLYFSEENPLMTKTGGTYMPPHKLRALQASITDKTSEPYQRLTWEALKKSLNGLVNKVTFVINVL